MSVESYHSWHPRAWPTLFALLILRAIGLLPLPVLWALAWPLGRCLYLLVGSRRHITQRNLSRCFPQLSTAQIRRLARRHFSQLCQNALAAGIIYFGGARRIRRLVRYKGLRYFEEARAGQRNIILLAPHFLGLDIAGVRLSLDYPGASMYQPIHNRVLDEQIHRARQRFGAKLIPHNIPLRPLLRLVRGGTPFYYLPDQSPSDQEGIFAPFFNISTLTYATLGRMATLTKAVVIPCGCFQRPYGRGFELVFYPPLQNFPINDEQADTARMNQVVEELVREHIDQYMWIHRRFKVRPPGEEPFYG